MPVNGRWDLIRRLKVKTHLYLNLCLDILWDIYDYSVLRCDQLVVAVDRTTRMVCHGQPYT